MDRGEAGILVLLDLSAAFDTVDHDILLGHLEQYLGITNSALDWFRSYVIGRTQSVNVLGATSEKHHLQQGVPQGSVLGPVLFTVYMLPLGEIVKRYRLTGYYYADDGQLYLTFKPADGAMVAQSELGKCCEAIKDWMTINMLKLNEDKTEVVAFGTNNVLSKLPTPTIHIGEVDIPASPFARNLGCIQDSQLKMVRQVNQICSAAFYHLRNISRIRSYLTREVTEQLVHAFVVTRLDQCNSLLYGISSGLVQKLQRVQNAAARIVTQTSKRDSITATLYSLHWLPVVQRIQFKVLLFTYRAQNDLAPPYLSDLLVPYMPTRSLRSFDQNLLTVPKTRLLTAGDRVFVHAAPELWNSLPVNI
jgi:hypothetical protein